MVARRCTARCSRGCDSVAGEHLIYNRTTANSRFSEKNKNRKNPLRLMQNGSDEPLIQWLAENPASKLGNFQPVTASPYRVLHQAQGDKQEINPIRLKSSSKTNGSTQRNDVLRPRKMGLFPVYRLEEADSLLKEGGVWVSGRALRACSYKTHPKPKHQGEAPRLFKGFILVFVFHIWYKPKATRGTLTRILQRPK